jgi:hypothetical protein
MLCSVLNKSVLRIVTQVTFLSHFLQMLQISHH